MDDIIKLVGGPSEMPEATKSHVHSLQMALLDPFPEAVA